MLPSFDPTQLTEQPAGIATVLCWGDRVSVTQLFKTIIMFYDTTTTHSGEGIVIGSEFGTFS